MTAAIWDRYEVMARWPIRPPLPDGSTIGYVVASFPVEWPAVHTAFYSTILPLTVEAMQRDAVEAGADLAEVEWTSALAATFVGRP